jgi:hypothetical protein
MAWRPSAADDGFWTVSHHLLDERTYVEYRNGWKPSGVAALGPFDASPAWGEREPSDVLFRSP